MHTSQTESLFLASKAAMAARIRTISSESSTGTGGCAAGTELQPGAASTILLFRAVQHNLPSKLLDIQPRFPLHLVLNLQVAQYLSGGPAGMLLPPKLDKK